MKTVDEFLNDINDDIESKCIEIKRKREEKRWNIIFLTLCSFIFVMPIILIIFGVSVLNVLLTFLVVGAFVLGTFVITKTLGGVTYEQTVRYEL